MILNKNTENIDAKKEVLTEKGYILTEEVDIIHISVNIFLSNYLSISCKRIIQIESNSRSKNLEKGA